MQHLSRGILIAFEGIDGSGKSSLVASIANYCKANDVPHITTKEPGGSQLGTYIRHMLHEHSTPITPKAEYLLFAADRAQHFVEVIEPALHEKKLVLTDRFTDSSLVYQGYGRNLDLEKIRTINAWATNNRKPDVTIYVDIDIDTALERITQRGQKLTSFEKEARLFYEKLIQGYTILYKDRKDVLVLDGRENQSSITQKAITKIISLLS